MDLRLIQSLVRHSPIATPQPAYAQHRPSLVPITPRIAIETLLSGFQAALVEES